MTEQGENTELKAAQTKKAAGERLTPAEEVLIAVNETNNAASDAVERGMDRVDEPAIEPSVKER